MVFVVLSSFEDHLDEVELDDSSDCKGKFEAFFISSSQTLPYSIEFVVFKLTRNSD